MTHQHSLRDTIDDIARVRGLRSVVECNRVSFLISLAEVDGRPYFEIWLQGASTGSHTLTISAHHPIEVGTTLSFSTSMSSEDDDLKRMRVPVNRNADIPFRPFRMTIRAASHTENGGQRIRQQNGRRYRDVDAAPRNGTRSTGPALTDVLLAAFCCSWIDSIRKLGDAKHAADGGFSVEVSPP